MKEVPLCRFHLSSLKLTYFVLSSWFLNISCLGSVTFVFWFFGSIDTKLFLYPSTSLSNPELPSADTLSPCLVDAIDSSVPSESVNRFIDIFC